MKIVKFCESQIQENRQIFFSKTFFDFGDPLMSLQQTYHLLELN